MGCDKQTVEALAILWPVMSLHDRLAIQIDQGVLWNSENEAGMLDVLHNAGEDELAAARTDARIEQLLEQSMNADELMQARMLLSSGSERQAPVLQAVRERIAAASGYLDDDEDAVWDALLELTPAQRRYLWDSERELFDFIDDDDDRRSLERICTGSQAEALTERMRLATTGIGTNDDAVALVARKTGESARREQDLAAILV